MTQSKEDLEILAELNYAKNVRLERLMKIGIEELRQEEKAGKKVDWSSDVDPAFKLWNLSQAQKICVNSKEEAKFLNDEVCVVEKVYLRDRKIYLGEKVVVVTESSGEIPAYVLGISPAGISYGIEATSLSIKKCET